MRPFFEMSIIGIDRCREHHQIRAAYTLCRIGNVSVDGTQGNRRLEILDPSADSDNLIGQPLSPKNHPERPTDQPDTDDGDMLEVNRHGALQLSSHCLGNIAKVTHQGFEL